MVRRRGAGIYAPAFTLSIKTLRSAAWLLMGSSIRHDGADVENQPLTWGF
jgi:hypothetical protein